MSKKENTYSSPNKTHFNQSKKPDLLKHQVRTKDKNVQLHQPPIPQISGQQCYGQNQK